jgi:hypothetical protein
MPDPFNNDTAIYALHDVYEHAIKHGLTASGVEAHHLRFSDGERVEITVRTGSYTYPRDFVDWLTSFDKTPVVRVERRDRHHGNDLLLRARVEQGGYLWRIHWHTIHGRENEHRDWFFGGDDFLEKVAPIELRQNRQLLADELEKLIAWGHTFEWHEEDA